MKNLCIFIQICQIAVLSGGQKKSYLRRMCVFPLKSFHIEDVKCLIPWYRNCIKISIFCGQRHPQRVHRIDNIKNIGIRHMEYFFWNHRYLLSCCPGNGKKLLCPGFYDGFSHRSEAILPSYKMKSNEFLSDLSILHNISNDYHYYFYR